MLHIEPAATDSIGSYYFRKSVAWWWKSFIRFPPPPTGPSYGEWLRAVLVLAISVRGWMVVEVFYETLLLTSLGTASAIRMLVW